jgi:aconitate hydratase
MLRKKGVVGKFVEFFGDGLAHMPLADRATLGNMAPEFGSTCGIFPIDGETIRYLKLSGRDESQCELIEAYSKEQGLWREDGQADALYTDILELDLGDVEPSIAGPKRPQDRIALSAAAASYEKILADTVAGRDSGGTGVAKLDGEDVDINDGSILIAAITSCTNTSNPAVMLAAGLVARNAAAKGLTAKPWVKTSLAPGSRVVSDYLEKAELIDDLEAVGFYTVGYARDRGRRHGRQRRRHQRPVGQPEFRRPHSRPRPAQLPGLAATGRRLRAGRQHECRSLQ